MCSKHTQLIIKEVNEIHSIIQTIIKYSLQVNLKPVSEVTPLEKKRIKMLFDFELKDGAVSQNFPINGSNMLAPSYIET